MPRQSNSARTQSETRQIQTLTMRAAFQPATFNAENRSVEIVWTTGAKGLRRDWNGDYFEELEVSESAVRLKRLNNGAPLLAAHGAYSLDGVIGVVERAWLKDGEGRARVRFSERADADEIMKDVRAGILRNVSVGYAVHTYERIRSVGSDGKPDGGIDTYRAVDWEPMEISIVPIGFDDGAKVRSSEQPKTHTVEIRGNFMSKKRTSAIDDQTDGVDQIENEPEAGYADIGNEPRVITSEGRAAVRAERARVSTILSLSKKANLGDDFAAELIRSGVPLAEARAAIIDEMASEQQRTQGDTRGQHAMESGGFRVSSGDDYTSPQFRAQAMGEAIHARINPHHKPSDAARPYVGLTLIELARESLHSRGVSTRSMSGPRVIELALRGYHGVSDFPLALGDAVGRELLRSFESAEPGILLAGRKVTAPDFRARHRIKIGDAPNLEKVNEHGEFRRGTITEGAESWKLQTFGKMFSLSRQAIANDSLGAFSEIPNKMGIAARELEVQTAVDLLVSAAGAGPTMSDGVTLFHTASHGNLASSGGAIDVSTLGTARAALRLQKSLSGRVANFVPKYLIVPAAKETVAEQLLTQIEAVKTSDVNPFGAPGKLELIVEPRLDASSPTRWYLVADPGRFDGFEFAHLDGHEGPIVDTKPGWDVDGVEWKVRLDFGCGFVEHRSWFSNPGA